MPHDWSPLSLGLVCYGCATHILAAAPDCTPSVAEPDDAEAALARYLTDLADDPILHGIDACRAWAAE